jgi:hypothetical protein
MIPTKLKKLEINRFHNRHSVTDGEGFMTTKTTAEASSPP